ncbi:hypothetical protein V1505DRAFT_378992 [Lipomyces doorenjongii]
MAINPHFATSSRALGSLSNLVPTTSSASCASTLADISIPFHVPASKADELYASPDTSYLTDKERDAGESQCMKCKIMGMRPRSAGLVFLLSLIIILTLGLGLGLGLGLNHNSNDSSNSNSESASTAIQSPHPPTERNWSNGKRNFHVTVRNWTNPKRNWHID